MAKSLFDLAQLYLNQGVPEIDPIFQPVSPPPATTMPVPTPAPPEPIQGLTPEQLELLRLQRIQANDGPKGDFGIFNNLLKDTAKNFVVDVYDEEAGEFVPTNITGYRNVTSGLYQDKFGKNINPMFTNFPSVFSVFGKRNTVGGFKPGTIRGRYDSISDLVKGNKNEPPKMTLADIGKRKLGMKKLGKQYQEIMRTRDNDPPPSNVNRRRTDKAPKGTTTFDTKSGYGRRDF